MIWPPPAALGGGGVIVMLAVGVGWALSRQRPRRIETVEAVADATEAALPGFRVIGAVVGSDGSAGLAISEEGRVAVCRPQGKSLAVREVPWRRVRATSLGILIEPGERRFGTVIVAGVNALDIRRLSLPDMRTAGPTG